MTLSSPQVAEKVLTTGQSGAAGSAHWADSLLVSDMGQGPKPSRPQFSCL